MAKIPPAFKKDYSGGQINSINENLRPQNAVKLGLNVDFDVEIGSAVSRLGTGIVGAQLVDAQTVLGLINFRDSVGSNHKLLAAINASGGATSVVYDVEGAATIDTGLTANKKMRFLTYLDSVLMVNGTDAPRSYNGATVITTGGAFDLANFPGTGEPSLIIEWKDRVYAAGDTSFPDRVYYSGVQTAGAISWTSGNGNVNVEPEDGGGGLTAFGKVPGYVLFFKERSLKRWNFDSAFPEDLVQIGTPSQESVIMAGGLCAFFSASHQDSKGFYVTNGDRPVPISHDRAKNIKKWVDAIPQASYSSVAGWATERIFAWSVGDLTVDNETFTNVVLRYNRYLDQWSVRSYPSQFSVFSTYITSGESVIVGGDDDGQIIQIDKADTFTDYPSTPIGWEVRDHEDDFEYNQLKEISDKIITNTKGAMGAKVRIIPNGDIRKAVQLTDVSGRISEHKIDKPVRAGLFEISVYGNQQGGRATLKEVEVPSINALENYS